MPLDPLSVRLCTIRRPLPYIGSAVTLFLAGCASDYSVEDPNFGASVRHMIAVQTTDPNRGASGLDGTKAGAALDAYRQDTGDPKAPDNVALTLRAPR